MSFFSDHLANGSLLLSSLSRSSEGAYQCVVNVVTTSEGQDSTWTFLSRKALLRLADLPKFDAQPVDRQVKKGQPVAFHCLTSARPSGIVTWYHNDKQITAGPDLNILPVSNTLEISSVQPRHEGAYKCVLEGAGKRRTSQTGKLRIQNDLTSTELEFISSPRAQSVPVGSEALMECLVIGRQQPEVRWLKDSRQLVVDGNRVRRVGVSSLLISNVTLEDAGLYICRASGSDDSLDKAVALTVQDSPKILARPVSKVALETADVELECQSSGVPTPTISWYKNGESIIASDYFVVEANRLRILGLVKTDQGVYQCLVENEIGSEQAAAQLLVDSADSSSVAGSSGLPLVASAPLGFRTTTIGSRFISAEWDPPVQRNGEIKRYHVFYRESASDRERMLNTSSNSITITGLQPNTLYLIRVAAENEAGMGKSSENFKATTKREQAVPGRVANLQATALGSQTIEVRWDPPQGGPQPVRYKLFYIRHPADNDKETMVTIQSTAYTLHGMDKFTEYLIRVEAEGENGSGLTSDAIKVRTLSDLPAASPRDIVADPVTTTSIRVTWKEPDEEAGNGDITGYKLKYKTKQRGSKGSTYVIDPTEKEFTISGLEPGTSYLVRMAVINHNGTGPFSDWISIDTPLQDKEETLLGAPRELRPQAGPDYINVAWQPPADEMVLVRGYQIGWGHNIPDISSERVPGNVLRYKITGLKPGRDYVVSLRAFNQQGSGFPIYETVRTLSPATIPSTHDFEASMSETAGSPLGVNAETQSATSIRITWTDADPNAFNTMYTVRYSTSADGNQLRYVNSTETWVVVEGLRPATEYEFAVRAIVSGGTAVSPWSMAVRNRTWAAAPSSAPRDLTILPAASGDPHSVSLNWQPPKYANGEIEEYLILYSDRENVPDRDWTINYVAGDRLSHHISNLLPKASYFFKIQARNEKGYGPFSPIVRFTPAGGVQLSSNSRPSSEQADFGRLFRTLTANPVYIVVIGCVFLLILMCIIGAAICVMKKSSSRKNSGYTAGKKTNTSPGTDMWIQSTGNHIRGATSDYMVDNLATAVLSGPEIVESPPPRYQTLQDSAYGSVSIRNSRTPVRQSVSSYEETEFRGGINNSEGVYGRPTARAKPIVVAYPPTTSSGAGKQNDDYHSQGTLSRSYHQSSSSLEGRQRTPQVVYTGSARHQPIAKIDFSDSPYGSSSALTSATPPLPSQAPPLGPPQVLDGYRTLRGTPPNSASALRSFTALSGATPPPTLPPNANRPVLVTAGTRQLPVGRATAQPRVNVSNIYNSYATCSNDVDSEKKHALADVEMRSNTSGAGSTSGIGAGGDMQVDH
ncbi:hypothetical protein WR25_04368 isoform F [Diploscapter pachys]|uniref:Uncharacterized protein n=1 Tax=Diploscapter pachys TaxID=2018661 RepID=A0A2A2JGZ0_9BILA|nr:hypothetical protein WR25_04368 isoform F [Diploscapter pachys]